MKANKETHKTSTDRYRIGWAEKQAVMRRFDRSIREGLAFDRYGGVVSRLVSPQTSPR